MATPPWGLVFVDPDHPEQPATVRLRQVTRTKFALESALRYTGPTGVEGLPDAALTLRPADLGPDALTDLTTVPAPGRWFVGPYGVHTPAALLHDRLVGRRTRLPEVSDIEADLLFRHMLKALGVRLLRRWLMWTAVSLGTRWRSGGVSRWALVVWLLLATAGIAATVVGLVLQSWPLVGVAVAAPVVAAVLWGRQYVAGLVGAVTAIWVLPPTILGAVGFGIYWVLEHLVSALPISERVAGDEPVTYETF